jgi:hypothetical protein
VGVWGFWPTSLGGRGMMSGDDLVGGKTMVRPSTAGPLPSFSFTLCTVWLSFVCWLGCVMVNVLCARRRCQ